MEGEFSSAGIDLRAAALRSIAVLGWVVEIRGISVNICHLQQPVSGLSYRNP